MTKLTDIYAEVENQLQWGPALAPLFKELIAEVDAINVIINEWSKREEAKIPVSISPELHQEIKPLTLADVYTVPKIEELEQEVAKDSSEVSVLSGVVKSLESKLGNALHGLASLVSTEQAQEAQTIAAAPGITGILESPSPQPDPVAAAPTSTIGVPNE